jgi:hypothetical protein
MKKRNVYILWHVHELENQDDDLKFIGAYSSKKEANKAKVRFKDHSADLRIGQYELNKGQAEIGFLKENEDRPKAIVKKKKLAVEVIYDAPYYFIRTDSCRFGPFCPRCYEDKQATVRLIEQRTILGRFHCYICDSWYGNPNLGKYKGRDKNKDTIKLP